MKKMFLIFPLVFALTACGQTLEQSVWTPPPATPAPAVESTATGGGFDSLPAGTYIGVGTGGWNGDVTVSVTVDASGAISEIEVTDHSDTQSFAEPTFEKLTAAIVGKQSTDVDLATGASSSAKAFREAVENALVQAGVTVEQLRAGAGTGGGAAAPSGNYNPGTFVGVGTGGWYGEVHVELTFSETAITGVEVVYSGETESFAGPAFESLTAAVLSQQTGDIDAHSGATSSSRAFIGAVQDAIAQASAGAPAPAAAPAPEPTATPEPAEEVEEVEVVVEVEEEVAVEVVVEEVPEEVETVEEVAEEPEEEQEHASPVVEEATRTRFTAGTYNATAAGFGGELSLSVEFDDENIVNISVTSHSETDDFFDFVVPTLPNNIIAAQSADVAIVSGATATSNAIKNAVESAIQQASN